MADLEITKLNYEIISEFAFCLRSVRQCAYNPVVKYLSNFKKIVLGCVNKGWLRKNPFYGFNLACRDVVKPFLTQEELDRMAAKVFATERLTIVWDIFLFSCYTGLAYVDVHKLQRSEIAIGYGRRKMDLYPTSKNRSGLTHSAATYVPGHSKAVPAASAVHKPGQATAGVEQPEA